MTSRFMRVSYRAYPPSVRDRANDYEDSDFARLDRDPAAHHVYANGEADVHAIEGNETGR